MSFKPRKCRLQNYKTGQIIEADSISEFCRQAKLDGNSKYHITPILDGKPARGGYMRFHHKGWHIPIKKKIYTLKDIYGNYYAFDNPVAFSKQYKLSTKLLYNLLNKKVKIARGFFLEGSNVVFKEQIYHEIRIRKGNSIIQDRNQSKIAKLIKKHPSYISKLTNGDVPHAGGWEVDKIFIKKKKRPSAYKH